MSDQTKLSTEEFTSAVESLMQLIPDEELDRLQPSHPVTVYTTLVTLWMMIMQRLGEGKTLAATVKDVLATNRALLPDNKRVREGTLSEASGAYSRARQRLHLKTVEFFARRDIRDVKVSLDTENIRARSVEMVKKELLTSIVAYNLVMQFRRQAAAIAKLPPRRLSFTGVWNTFESFLLHQPPCDAAEWVKRYEGALQVASRDKLPNRPGRSYPRKAHPRRQKSTKFIKKQNSKSPTIDEKPPPEKPK